ncbi:unnamed protein product [Rotaria sordida]|uniref:UDP-N-acetylglucosamine diphosphorylase n=1 Tax=Rotaria sordida TaxID=392033 RepID=A0A814HXG8_9BILA|nr:unnamed protein product [Rotaria sordida]CAF1015414.1 unnamed protein product [Rotaria sordida]
MDIDPAIYIRLKNFNQIHLLSYWNQLDHEQRAILIQDINNIDLDHITQAFQHIKDQLIEKSIDNNLIEHENKETIDQIMQPIPEHLTGSIDKTSKEQLEYYRRKGLEAIAEGSVCVLLLAGGQGTRLGVNNPKGMYDVGLPSKKSLYQIQAERICRLEQLANEECNTTKASIPWFIMTSEHTRNLTEDYFFEHNYFGLKSENIILFEQHTLPALDFHGKILLDEKYKLTKAADGNGGLYRALKTRHILSEMKKRQIKYIHIYCVDNILVRIADPIFLGFCLDKKTDCAAKVVKKSFPDEPVGVICKIRNHFRVVEYSEIPEQVAQRKKTDNSEELLFNAGNICNHFFTFDFLQDICQNHENKLCYHIAKKKIPSIDKDGKRMDINGIKLEKFVFDVFSYAKNFFIWEVRREDEFSPLKNASGTKDTAITCRRDLMLQHVRWLQAAGAIVPLNTAKQIILSDKFHDNENNSYIEISPLISYAGENLEFIKGQILKLPLTIELK